MVVKVTTVNPHNTTQHDNEESKESEGLGRDKIGEEQNAENSVEKGDWETERRIDKERWQ